MNEFSKESAEPTPVDDVRRIRERFDREAGKNMHLLAEEARQTAEHYRKELGLRTVVAPEGDTNKNAV